MGTEEVKNTLNRLTENPDGREGMFPLEQPAKKTFIYAYRLTSDTGSAPCIWNVNRNPTGLLTLACCGQIWYKDSPKERGIYTGLRHTIGKRHKEKIANGQDEVYLMGMYKNKLLYFAKITEILLMDDYFAPNSCYKDRYDNIYEILSGNIQRNTHNPKFHPVEDTVQHTRDKLGKYVLVSNCFAYFGEKSEAIPVALLNILPLRQENKSYELDTHNGEQIMRFVTTMWNFKDIIQESPHMKGCKK